MDEILDRWICRVEAMSGFPGVGQPSWSLSMFGLKRS
jgi:hypothetical protein